MAGLDSNIALALMAKADLVFGGPGKLLSFPLGAASYTEQQLTFFPDQPSGESARATLVALADFSAFTSYLPSGRLWQRTDRSSLAHLYRRVLEQSEVARIAERPEDVEQLHTARAVLVQAGPDGREIDTPAYAAYREYRDRFLLALQNYNAAKGSGEIGATAEEAAEWAHNEPLLQAARDQADSDWTVLGRRVDIDDAIARITTLTRRTPASTWSRWELLSRVGVGSMNDLTGALLWPTYINPANAASVGWMSMSLTGGEIRQLQQNAPPELRERLAAGASALTVERLDFEFSSAQLHRPWFDGSLFASRFWRPRTDPDLVVSSGGPPFEGACPLYASGVVFFRRIKATVKGPATSVQTALRQLSTEQLHLGLFRFDQRSLRVIDRPQDVAVAPVRVIPREIREERLERFNRADAVLAAPAAPAAAPFVGRELAIGNRLVFRKPVGIRIVNPTPVHVDPRPVQPRPPTTSVIQTGDEIFVLALICSIVPTSPDPDPTLVWSD